MGVPDLLKFVARSAPGALCRIPKYTDAQRQEQSGSGTASIAVSTLLEYDYVLVDTTNAAQTIGFERLYEFLSDPRLVVHKAIVLALDAGRTREGTARHHRQAHLMIGDLDVKVQQLCSSLTELFRKRAVEHARRARESNQKPTAQVQVPYVVMSGRNVAGEADYKSLDLQRFIVSAALAAKETTLPRFLFISEDSDVLCGTLCGPAPQNVSIATNLRDTLFELCILRLEHVLTYVAVCIDALVGGEDQNAGAAIVEEDEAVAKEEEEAQVAQDEAAPVDDAAAKEKATDALKAADENVVRRKKQDGPMVAAGTRVTLGDSSSSDDDEHAVDDDEKTRVEAKPSAANAGKTAALTVQPFDLAAGKMVHGSCVDLVFLFVVVMGNGVNVPPLVRGVTKVDIASCWQAYCKHKFTAQGAPDVAGGGFITLEEREMGRNLVTTSSPAANKEESNRAHLCLNSRFLLAILESVHYADTQSRPPVEEEKACALAYLSSAMYATLRYIVACNVNSGAALQETFLDSRPLTETAARVPSLAAVLWVLGQEAAQTFRYPLQGLAKKELLALQSVKPLATAASPSPAPARREVGQKGENATASSTLTVCVGETLVCPPSASANAASWAMARGGGGGGAGAGGSQGVSRTYTLQHIMATPNTVSLSAGKAVLMRGGSGSASAGGAPADSTSVASFVKLFCHQQQQLEARKNTFVALCETWRRSVAMAVPQLKRVARKARFMSPVTGNVVEGPLAATSPQGADGSAAGAVSTAAGAATKFVYSFELRRMTPLLTTEKAEAETASGRSAQDASLPNAAERPSSAAAPATISSAQAALQAALGLSFDYAKAPAVPAHLVVDPKEVGYVKPAKQGSRQGGGRKKRGETASPEGGAEPAAKVVRKEGDGEESKKYRRPGKKERKRLQLERQRQGKKEAATGEGKSTNTA